MRRRADLKTGTTCNSNCVFCVIGDQLFTGDRSTEDCIAELQASRATCVDVVFTDGRDENATSDGPGSLRAWDEVLALQQKTDAAIYVVGLGSRVDRPRLQELADRSGGAAYFPAGSESLSAQFANIIDEMRRRYVVGWESSNRERSGQWRKVDILVGPGVTVRSRGGYFAPAE